jgi:translation initiation factor IF-3
LGRIESQPNLDGRNMVMVMAPRGEAGGQARGRQQESAARS